ncbi:ComEC/Rec2 family competence protein [Flavobacterium oreochromis]|uniref:ComEC/Rec2 family competence protein n=1 Tax=Flavobacterium oreochromis TaxID=2906078 RepID=UPI00385EE9F5
MKLYQFPLIKSVFWLIMGIILFHFFRFNFIAITFAWIILILSSLILSVVFSKNQKGQLEASILISLVFAISGIFISMLHEDTFRLTHFTHFNSYNKKVYIKAEVYERLKNTVSRDRYVISIQSINQKKSSGKVILNIRKNKHEKRGLTVGSVLLIKGEIRPIQSIINPGQFDYAAYLKTKNIYGQLYIAQQDFKKIKVTVKSLKYYTAQFRDRIVNKLRNDGFPEKELAVLTALIIGQQQELDPDLIKAYQYAGVVHMLSISGLHVGILYLLLDFIFLLFLKDKRYKLLKLFFVLLGLWGFAFVAGLAASVVRSTVMFSMLAIGSSFNKQVNVYNTLAASILLILIVQPFFLFDIGFQLSYLAVGFIISLQPVLIKLWNPKNKILIFFWNLFIVSLVAQVGTLPLSLYYFHQIPGLFFVANLLTIPLLEYIIMPLGVLVVLLASLDYTFYGLVKILVETIQIMNSIIERIASFQNFIWETIPFSIDLMLFSYAIIIIFFVWIQRPRFKVLITFFSFLLLFQFTLLFKKIEASNQEKLIVFHLPGQRLIGFAKGRTTFVYFNTLMNKGNYIERLLKDYEVQSFNSTIEKKKEQDVFLISGKKVLLIDSDSFMLNKKNVDFLILSNSPKINLERILMQYTPKKVIIDGSNFKSYIKRFEETCIKRKIPFHNTFEKGSCIIE